MRYLPWERSKKMVRGDFSKKWFYLLVLLIVTSSLLPVHANGRSYKHEEKVNREFSTRGLLVVSIENSRGDVKIIGEKGASKITLEAIKIVRTKSEDRAKKILNLLEVDAKIDGDRLKIKAIYPKKNLVSGNLIKLLFEGGNRYRTDFIVRIPYGMGCRVYTASGDVSVGRIGGKLRVSTSSGDVRVDECGETSIEVSSGDVEIGRCVGTLHMRSASGDIRIVECEGDFDAQTASGDVSLAKANSVVTIKTASGDAYLKEVSDVTFNGASGSLKIKNLRGVLNATASSGDIIVTARPERLCDYRISTSSGDVVLEIDCACPGGFALNIQTANGEISADLPEIDIQKISRNILKGIVGEGKGTIKIQTATGDIEIHRTGSD